MRREPLLIGQRELAAMMGVSEQTVYRLRKQGGFLPPAQRVSGVRWVREKALAWINAGCPPVTTELAA